MPPAVSSEDEASASEGSVKPRQTGRSNEVTPRKSVVKQKSEDPSETIEVKGKAADGEPETGEEDGGEDAEEDEEVYVVEKILDHDFAYDDGQPRYQIKWLGYNKVSDRTWEVKENLEGARELLQEYWDSIGGEPVAPKPKPSGSKKRRRASTTNASEADTPAKESASKKPKRGKAKKEEPPDDPIIADEWSPPTPAPGAWENEVVAIETIEGTEDNEKVAWLRWASKDENDEWRGFKAKLSTVYIACPQRMLKFYENHLVFTDPSNSKKKNGR